MFSPLVLRVTGRGVIRVMAPITDDEISFARS